ncbi:FimV/HubP family polar landmark protein [Luteimonas galliterrae]|uniref:FimV/HubP family polar landmark protein n=1 Tax=Luteimonas galliterrae TaxID=2940486 RepID=UPI002019B2A8|nr:FimV/HubP family polar landmark protein [Luteimonas galliterrae]
MTLLLALACGQALALGLGQIQVKSKAGQPLLAEIPIVSNDPAELEQLQARLASPETFARIGLEPPQGAVADLQFAVVRDNSGGLAVRVTSTQPITQPMLTFLVEVEWGQGKLVREYSALVDPPRDAPSPSAPMIDAPQAALADRVTRPAEAPAAIDASPTELGPEQQAKPAEPAAEAPPRAVAAEPNEPPPSSAIGVAPPPAPMPSPDEAAAAVPPPQDGVLAPVKAGQTLSEIAVALKPAGYTLDQTMLALLRTNPDAFIGNDINKLKQGAVLRAPGADEIASLGAAEAAVIVRDQIEQWRRARQERAQARAASIAAMAATGAAAETTNAAAPKSPAVAGARLEIIPPAADGAVQAGTRSGASAGGEGDMLRQQQELQTTKETLAARDAEVQELKSRLADLEKLQQQQQQLIALKDSELAAAQQRLAQSNQAAAKPASTTQATPKTPADQAQADSGTALWLGGGLLLVVVGLLGWWLARRGRRTPAPKSARPVTDSAALAASMPNAEVAEPAPPVSFASVPPVVAEPASRGNGASQPPTRWAGNASAPTWHGGATGNSASGNGELRIGHERIELARAYMDLGDHDTARGLLQEIVQVGDPDARAEAVRMLQDLPR